MLRCCDAQDKTKPAGWGFFMENSPRDGLRMPTGNVDPGFAYLRAPTSIPSNAPPSPALPKYPPYDETKRGRPCLKPNPTRVLQNQTQPPGLTPRRGRPQQQKSLHHQPQVRLLGGSRPPPRAPGDAGGGRSSGGVTPTLPPAVTSRRADRQRRGGRPGVIYTPPAARLSRRKEPTGGKHLSLLLLASSIAPGRGDVWA